MSNHNLMFLTCLHCKEVQHCITQDSCKLLISSEAQDASLKTCTATSKSEPSPLTFELLTVLIALDFSWLPHVKLD